MSVANIKIKSKDLQQLKLLTGQETGQKAVETALRFFVRQARQRKIIETLQDISFRPGFDPLKLRKYER